MIALWNSLGQPAARTFALALLLSALSAVLGIALLGLSGWFLAAAAAAGASGAGHAFNHLYPSTGVRTFAVGRVLSRYAEQLVGHEATLKVSSAIRPLVFERLARTQRGMASLPAGDLALIVDDVSSVEAGFLRVVSPAVGVTAAALVAIGWVAAVSPIVAFSVFILFLVVCVGLPLILLNRARAASEWLSSEQGMLRSDVSSVVENAIELEISGVLGAAMMRANDRLKSVQEAQDRLQNPFRNAAALIGMAGGLAALLVVVSAIVLQVDGAVAAGAALATLAAFEAASSSTRILDAHARASASSDRLMMRLRPDVAAKGGDAVVTTALPLRLDAVRVTVGETGGVGPVSLTCDVGDLVELSGRSGVGKTTILEAVAALRPIQAGSLSYGGVEQVDVRPASVLARVAVAPQFPAFLPGSLREQLAYGRPDASDQDIAAALAAVCLDLVVAGRQSEDAAAFSGGERRRLGIARALIVDPELLLLDEPFAGLEAGLAERIRANLARWTLERRRAIIFTSHETGTDWAGVAVRHAGWSG
jgi:ATP-binding cassette subfamily C protein CydC